MRGYDFFVNVIWLEIVINIEVRIYFIFVFGNFDVFYKVSNFSFI